MTVVDDSWSVSQDHLALSSPSSFPTKAHGGAGGGLSHSTATPPNLTTKGNPTVFDYSRPGGNKVM